MNASKTFAAIDLGAESGRVVLAKVTSTNIDIEEVHRFSNGPVRLPTGMHWDILKIFSEIKIGLGKCKSLTSSIDGIGLDTWGVDFGLLDSEDRLICNPYHYRDPRSDGMMEKAFSVISRDEIFAKTGIQFMQINSLYQMLAMKDSPVMQAAKTFLTIPDLLDFWLSGTKVCEFTNATTTQMYDQLEGDWARGILDVLGIPTEIFPEVIRPGTVLGNLADFILVETGLSGQIPIVAPACHDTGSAVAAVPAVNKNFAYISSGTWSLVGVETGTPIINPKSLEYNFTNEGGVDQSVRLLKNVTGLWLLQECRRIWASKGKNYSYAELANMAQNAPAFKCLIDPDAPNFLNPVDMPAEIVKYCSESNQPVPENDSSMVRSILESLSLKYRYVMETLEELTGETIEVIHVIGGGSQNELLNQLTADATGKPVLAGPVEATAIGNAMVQAVASGMFSNINECRKIISEQGELKLFEPKKDHGLIDDAYDKFRRISNPK